MNELDIIVDPIRRRLVETTLDRLQYCVACNSRFVTTLETMTGHILHSTDGTLVQVSYRCPACGQQTMVEGCPNGEGGFVPGT